MSSRRTSKRLEIALPLRVTLLGIEVQPPAIDTQTRNISAVGLSTQLPVTLTNRGFFMREGEKQVNLIPYLVQSSKEVSLEITLPPPHGENLWARGKITWYTLESRQDSYIWKAGISFKEMAAEDKEIWEKFVRHTALETGRLWHRMQVGGTVIFGSGIVLFVIGFNKELITVARIGIVSSLVGLIGFLLGWWKHRSYLLLKKFKLFD
jgi:hypothetical protein